RDRDRLPGSRPRPEPGPARGLAGGGSGARASRAERGTLPRRRPGGPRRGWTARSRPALPRLSARAERRTAPARGPRSSSLLPARPAARRRTHGVARLHDPGRGAGASLFPAVAARPRRPHGQPRSRRPDRPGPPRPRDVRGGSGRGGDAGAGVRRAAASPRTRSLPRLSAPGPALAPGMSDEPLVTIRGLTKRYRRRAGASSAPVEALAGVSLTIERGTVLALVGQSGSGKSTLARCLAGQEEPDAGEIRFRGEDVSSL